MRTQIRNEAWGWIIWLILLTLLNAIALAGGRGNRGGADRGSSAPSAQPQQSHQSRQSAIPARSETKSAPSRSSQPAAASQSRVRQSETTRSAPQVAVSQERPSSTSSRGNRSVLSQSRTQDTTSYSRPVKREVIVAPSSQSMDVSSSPTVSRSVSSGSSGAVTRSSQSGRTRTVEVISTGGNSVSSTTPSTRRNSTTQTNQVAVDKSQTSGRQSLVTVLERQSRGKVENTIQPQLKDSGTVTTQPVITPKTPQSKDPVSGGKSGGSKPSVIPGNLRNDHKDKGTDIRLDGKQSDNQKVDPVIADKGTKDRPQRDRPSKPDIQKPGNGNQADKPASHDRNRIPSDVAARKDVADRYQKGVDSGGTDSRSDSRWSKLRSKITAKAELDLQPRNDRQDRGGHNRGEDGRGRVVVDDKNIHIERGDRDGRGGHHRPDVSRHLIHDIRPICDDHRWRHHGSYYSYDWSNYSCGRVILAPYNDCYGVSYYYPSYHRKYLFVSLGGYWPYSYRYHRYYWYGCHPYYWYGSYVVSSPEPVVYEYPTYNNEYVTYNNYYNTPTATAAVEPAVTTDLTEGSTVTDTPLPQTQADINFANAVNAFDEGSYANAVELFREALLQSPEDEIMPFTYTQALFANGDYAQAAYVLREVMAKMPSENPSVYYPRGLYKDDQTLLNQIAQLEGAIAIEPFSTDYQLLLGYQYLGIAQWDKAVNALEQAARSPLNTGVVNKLLDIAEKMEKDAPQTITAPQS